MGDDDIDALEMARRHAYAMPLDEIDMSRGERFRDDTIWPFFERLRREDPVHLTANSSFGPYWSITRYDDIMAIETNHDVFSSASGISIFDLAEDFPLPMFIAMDPPKHDAQRKVVSPAVSPQNLANLEPIIRARAGDRKSVV